MDGLTLPDGITLREATTADEPFLFEVYAASRAEELAVVPWDEGTRRAFLEQQSAAQDTAYRSAYPPETFNVVLRDGDPIGRLYLADLAAEIRVVDLALLPEARGKGLGTALMRAILAAAERTARPVTLHVEAWNPAFRMYERLGFVVIDDGIPYRFMRWDPPAPPKSGDAPTTDPGTSDA